MGTLSALHALPLRYKILALGACLVVVELAFRKLAPNSIAYRRWSAGILAIGRVWTGVLLLIVYLGPVGVAGLVARVIREDLLDRDLRPEPSWWRSHEENPLGPEAAARHQF
jgi:hypothetical protein